MSTDKIANVLRCHYPNISAETYAELRLARQIVLGLDEALSLEIEEALA